MGILDRKLTEDEQVEILDKLFGFYFKDDVLYTNGEEFYSIKGNSNFSFSTLEGIFEYAIKTSVKMGYNESQNDIKKALGI